MLQIQYHKCLHLRMHFRVQRGLLIPQVLLHITKNWFFCIFPVFLLFSGLPDVQKKLGIPLYAKFRFLLILWLSFPEFHSSWDGFSFLKRRKFSAFSPVFLYWNRNLNKICSFRPYDLYFIEQIYQILQYSEKIGDIFVVCNVLGVHQIF